MNWAAGAKRASKRTIERDIRESRRAVLVVNTRSRRGARLYSDATRRLEEAGITLSAGHPIRHPEVVPEVVQREIARGERFVIVGGGDGTISSVVDHLAFRDVVLGVLPLGTANSFARALGIPLDLPGAIDVVVNGKVADVDLGKVGDDYFANGAAIGLPPAIARAVPHRFKRWAGRVAYGTVGLKKLLSGQGAFRCTVRVNGQQVVMDTLDVRIAVGGYQGGVLVAPESHLDDGDLVVQVLDSTSRWVFAESWIRAVLHLEPCGHSRAFRAAAFEIECTPPQDVSLDGEIVAQTPIRASISREALMVVAPAAFDDHDGRDDRLVLQKGSSVTARQTKV